MQSPQSVSDMWCIDIPTGLDLPTDRLLEPRRAKGGTLRCRVRRTREKALLELSIEEGNVFVLSACRQGKDWLISEQPGGSTKNYIARLRTGKDRSFTCVRCRDERGSESPELLHVRHSTEQLSDELPELNTMQLCLTRPQQLSSGLVALGVDGGDDDGGPSTPISSPSGVLSSQLNRVYGHGARERCRPEFAILESRRPKWNPRTETYELPFAGRANWASARNFQLIERDGQPDRAVLLYGKLEEDEFALDFSHPLSMLHALAIVLTTWGW